MKIVPLLSAVLCVASMFVVGCRPLIDGGWSGDADCGNDVHKVDAIFNEDGGRKLDGVVYVDNIFGGLAARGEIENAEVDDDGSYNGELESDGDDTPDFSFNFEYDDGDPDRVKGDVDVLDNGGQPTDTCKLDLERQSVND